MIICTKTTGAMYANDQITLNDGNWKDQKEHHQKWAPSGSKPDTQKALLKAVLRLFLEAHRHSEGGGAEDRSKGFMGMGSRSRHYFKIWTLNLIVRKSSVCKGAGKKLKDPSNIR